MIPLVLLFLSSFHYSLVHFQLIFPPSRGYSESSELASPCGGYNVPVDNRTQLPLDNPFVEINSEHQTYTYSLSLILADLPTAADYFNTSTSYLTIKSGTGNFTGATCLPFNLPHNITSATNATLQVVYTSDDGQAYQCTDVTFLPNVTGFNTSMCVNADGTHPLVNRTSQLNLSSEAKSQASGGSHFNLVTRSLMCSVVFAIITLI